MEYYNDDLFSTSWLGEVVDIDDPDKIGRVKIKVFGKFDDLPVEHIPWAFPASNLTAGSDTGGGFLSVPKLNSIVSVKFDNGNIYHPEYFFNQRISNELKDEVSGDYIAAQSLLFDTEESLKLYYVRGKGLRIELKDSLLNLLKDDEGIFITTKGTFDTHSDKKTTIDTSDELETSSSGKTVITAPEIYLGNSDATEPLLFGNKTDDWLNELLDMHATTLELLIAHVHDTGVGPTTPTTVALNFTEQRTNDLEALRAKIITLKSIRNFTK